MSSVKRRWAVTSNLGWTREQIETLDLDPIKLKLMDPDEGEGWPRGKADQVDLEYRRFLYLTAKYPSRSIVPTKDVDTFWHAHILDTRKYAEDCERIFGRFIHHFPYLGMRGEEDSQALRAAFMASKKLYTVEFGTQPIGTRSDCSQPGACNAKCDVTPSCEETPDGPFPDIRPSLTEKTPRVHLHGSAA